MRGYLVFHFEITHTFFVILFDGIVESIEITAESYRDILVSGQAVSRDVGFATGFENAGAGIDVALNIAVVNKRNAFIERVVAEKGDG